jgi:2,4-dienoyl-CoA reductase (NADPH2)
MATDKKFTKLLEPGMIGNVKTRNRMVKTGASMLYWQGHESESMNDYTLGYYGALARGGVGLLIVESPIIDYPWGGRWFERYRFDDDKYLPGMKQLVDTIHSHGCPTFMQMNHDGPWQNPLFPGIGPLYEGQPVGASAVKLDAMGDFHNHEIRPLSVEEIEVIVDKAAAAALRARKAGYDGIDINAASSHLFHNFLSAYWNRRTDEYGGTQEKRTKLIADIVREIKKRVGDDFPVSVCVNSVEVGRTAGIDDEACLTHEDMKVSVRLIEAAGADLIHVRSQWLAFHVGGFLPEQLLFPELPLPLDEAPELYNLKDDAKGAVRYLAASLKKEVSIPVMTVGRIELPTGEEMLENGEVDFVAMHRPLMTDAELPNKVSSGRTAQIRPCTRCGTCLDEARERHRRCRMNPHLGEKKYEMDSADTRKKVLVVGGGPGGMEAALVSAERGHDVTLCEKNSELGGRMRLAQVVKGTEIEDLYAITDYFIAEFDRLGVKVCLNTAMDEASVLAENADVVYIAQGAVDYAPDLPGIDKPNVVTMPKLMENLKAIADAPAGEAPDLPVGKNVVIVGTSVYALEVAEYLIKSGRKVALVDTADRPGIGMLDYRMGLILPWFEKTGTPVLVELESIDITDAGVAVTKGDGETETFEADTVLTVQRPKENLDLYNSLKGKVSELHAIGDCNSPGLIVDAIRKTWAIAKDI